MVVKTLEVKPIMQMFIWIEKTTNIVEREVEASMCEIEQENINDQGLHCSMDDEDDCESRCDETHGDDDCKSSCELVNPIATNQFGEVEIVNDHMHAPISYRRMDENYVDVKFDEEQLTGDEWLHMIQQKDLINTFLFGERIPLVSRSQVEDNMFTTAQVCKEVESKVEKEEEEKKTMTIEHNENAFKINLECAKYK